MTMKGLIYYEDTIGFYATEKMIEGLKKLKKQNIFAYLDKVNEIMKAGIREFRETSPKYKKPT